MTYYSASHDVEAGKAAMSSTGTSETHHAQPTEKVARHVLRKMTSFMHPAQHKKAAGKPIPNDLELPAMTRILRNMVAVNDLHGVTDVLTKMQCHEKSDGFTIQDVAGNGLLQIAALNNFDEMTRLLLDKGFDINYVDDNHGTALQAAIYMDSGEVLKVLLDRTRIPPIKVDTAGGYYGCALQVAAFKGSSDYIKQLVKLGANEDVYIAKSKYGTALQAAARTGLPLLLKQILALEPTQINREGGAWGTALQAAAKGDYTEATAKLRQLSRGRVLSQANEVDRKKGADQTDYLKVATILLAKGAKVNVNSSGRLQTPINAAASSGQIEMLKLLLDKDDASNAEKRQKYGRALLSAITQTFEKDSRLLLVTELVSRGADVNFEAGSCLQNRPLAAAAAVNDEKVVKYLLEISKEDKQRLMDAESGIYGSALRAALSAPQPAKATTLHLINAGADTIHGDENYGNILHLAAFENLPEIVSILLDRGKMDVNVLDKNYQTALHIAAYRGYEQVVEKLLQKKADANLKDVWGDIPLDIVGGVIARESHPAPSLQGLRQIREMLLKKSMCKDEQQICGPFPGPLVAKRSQPPKPERQKAKPVFELPKWNPGLKFYAKIVDFLEKNHEQEHVLVGDLSIDDLLYKANAITENMDKLENGYDRKLRWIHLPTNNMTWAEMLMKILWSEQYENTTCKSIWGTDPYFVSPDLAPHARFVTPQCGRLIQESTSETHLPRRTSCEGTVFFAMPYIHWESFSSQCEVSKILDKMKKDISKTKIWRSNGGQANNNYSRQNSEDVNEPSPPPGGDDGVPGARNPKSTDYDAELLKIYLYKRWPVHMRRTLDQYYYSYLADTKTRDGDQVAMRARERKLHEEAEFSALYVTTEIEKDAKKKKKNSKPKLERKDKKGLHQTKDPGPKHDDNSPVVMIDQLWLWVVSPSLVVTSFPRRRSVKQDGDLDPEDKTDVLETLLDYLHSTKRAPINNAYDLCELVVSQTVGILHRSDMIPELDFLKIFATQADWAIDRVMTGLTEFVEEYKVFMKWLNGKNKDPNEYVKQFEKIFSVTTETELLREIQDMKDELNMLSAVFNDQKLVLKKVGEEIETSRTVLESKSSDKTGGSPKALLVESSLLAFSFQQQSDKHAGHIKRMQDQANQAYNNLQDLLNFKQQQANVLEARVNRNQAITSKEQNKTIIVFTIVTIIFLPLTFMTTVFTLPVLDFPRYDPTTLEPSAMGNLKGNFVFSIITGFTLIMAIPLIIAAFKVRRLQSGWDKIKKLRIHVFPLHLANKHGPPEPDEVDGEMAKPLWWRFYWGGPSPRRDDRPDDI